MNESCNCFVAKPSGEVQRFTCPLHRTPSEAPVTVWMGYLAVMDNISGRHNYLLQGVFISEDAARKALKGSIYRIHVVETALNS